MLGAKTIVLLAIATTAHGHGAMTFPRPRNAMDGDLEPWTQWAYPCDSSHKGDDCKISFCEDGQKCQGSCPVSAHNPTNPLALNASNGQVLVACCPHD